jgi:diamine N-acetyltransferase
MSDSPTPPLRFVPLSVEHLDDVMTWVNDREVMQYFANRQTDITAEDERRYLETLIASRNDRAWSVHAGDGYVGQVSINQIYWPARNGRIFLVVRKSMQHKGHGTAMLRGLLRLAWEELDLHKLWLIVRKDNRAAQAMYLKQGFDFEGVLRDEYHVGGRFHDMVRMAVFRLSAQGAT